MNNMKDRFLYNNQKDSILDTLQEVDLISSEIVDLLNEWYEANFELESECRYYKGLYDMYEYNFLALKKGVEGLIRKYNDLCVKDKDNEDYSLFVGDLEDLF